jgi:hypothetical protein
MLAVALSRSFCRETAAKRRKRSVPADDGDPPRGLRARRHPPRRAPGTAANKRFDPRHAALRSAPRRALIRRRSCFRRRSTDSTPSQPRVRSEIAHPCVQRLPARGSRITNYRICPFFAPPIEPRSPPVVSPAAAPSDESVRSEATPLPRSVRVHGGMAVDPARPEGRRLLGTRVGCGAQSRMGNRAGGRGDPRAHDARAGRARCWIVCNAPPPTTRTGPTARRAWGRRRRRALRRRGAVARSVDALGPAGRPAQN